MTKKYTYHIYTDGGCAVNPGGPGGYGVVLMSQETKEKTELSKGYIIGLAVFILSVIFVIPLGLKIMIFSYCDWILRKGLEDSMEDASRILKQYCTGKYFGKMAKTDSEQMERLQKTTQKALTVVSSRFPAGSISYKRYYGIVEAAGSTAIANVIQMANWMSLFDKKEYAALQHYQEDNIPDDVQKHQIALYQKSISQIQKTIEINERLILKMNSLAMEIMSETEKPDVLLEEIEELTKQAKYYK